MTSELNRSCRQCFNFNLILKVCLKNVSSYISIGLVLLERLMRHQIDMPQKQLPLKILALLLLKKVNIIESLKNRRVIDLKKAREIYDFWNVWSHDGQFFFTLM